MARDYKTVCIPEELHDKLRYLAYRTKRPIVDIVHEILAVELKKAMQADAESQRQEYLAS
jgi:predicted DNA-binding protein